MALAGCGEREQAAKAPAAKPAPAAIAGDAKAGKAFAETECKACHGLDGGSVAPGVPHLAAQNERYLLASLKAYKEGKRGHAALKVITERMSEADIRNVAAYYAGLPASGIAPAKSRARGLLPMKPARRAPRPARNATARTATARRPAFRASPDSTRNTWSPRFRNTSAASASRRRCTP